MIIDYSQHMESHNIHIPNHQHFSRIFHYKPTMLDSHMAMETPILDLGSVGFSRPAQPCLLVHSHRKDTHGKPVSNVRRCRQMSGEMLAIKLVGIYSNVSEYSYMAKC